MDEIKKLQEKLIEAQRENAALREENRRLRSLIEAKELTVEQLCKASSLYQTELDQELETQIKEKCPELLKELQKITPDKKEGTDKNTEAGSTP